MGRDGVDHIRFGHLEAPADHAVRAAANRSAALAMTGAIGGMLILKHVWQAC